MRTGLFLVAGFLLMGGSLLIGKLFSEDYPSAPLGATAAYIALWIVIAAINMWVGVARAGYSVAEELPIFLLIASLPVTAAIFLKWKLL